MEILVLVILVGVVLLGWRLLGGSTQPSGSLQQSGTSGSGGATPAHSSRAPGATAAAGDPLAATNGLEEVLLNVARTMGLRLSTGAAYEPDLEAMAPQVAGAAAGLRDAGEVDAIETARSFFLTHVLVNLQAQPQLGSGAKAVAARAEVWIDQVLRPYLNSEPESRGHDLSTQEPGAADNYSTAQQAWSAAGLNIAIHGPGSADELLEVLMRTLPGLEGDLFGPFVEVVRPNMRLWVSLIESDAGSACVVSEVTRPEDGEFDAEVLSEIIPADVLNYREPTASGQGHWEASIFSRGATESAALAERLQGGRLVPPDRLERLIR